MKLAVIGKDVSGSKSPAMHMFIARSMGREVDYSTFSIPENEFESKIDSVLGSYDGINVTIPYKLSVMPHLKKIEGDARIFGAVNTVDCRTLTGYNTDGLGFMLMLRNNGVEVKGKKVLLIGAGGAGRAVAHKLVGDGAELYVYNRHFDRAASLVRDCGAAGALSAVTPAPYDIIINATGVGMHDSVGLSPVGEDVLSKADTAVDLIYRPARSRFLEIAEGLGKKTVNGLAMLFYQAYYAECIFLGATPCDGQAAELFEKYSKEIYS